ncbi:MAG: NAD(P)-dependent oxidoreductase [Thermus sp.]|uniref:NAD(P)-dependent oxidoreductase n=1 Tax=Thermus sp. TaxID=275 RepID=UPI0025F51421|nr:NAD(P)-dependent oxidoreductase [Thermus sp.]MCS7217781.1 NAD(P)-dependent oxidoreductase [Thermus sp.]MCX7849570.1 NAD(P)-dependent oxidoreductase [Thermus sp.]MDW8016599.1 NAD(P)-dependent oxidoreductase [Thermus sp.]MDW8356498.1 NAD(P)-dependent oxidoreductase [Thermus sp.]
MEKVAFLGLGAMGYPMAGHLARRFPTLVWNRTFAKALRHQEEFGSQAVPLERVAEAGVIFTCLPTTKEVVEVAEALLPHLRPGTYWVDATSGEPEASRRLAERLGAQGVTYLDAPVSGGTLGAARGTLTVMLGGPEEAVERVRPYLAYAGKVVHVGPVGAGHAVKAINNALLAVNLWAAGEGLLALVGQGVSAGKALEVINASSGRSNATENLIPERVLTRAFPKTFALGLLVKDLGIAMGVLEGAKDPSPLLRLTRELYEAAKRELGPEADHVEALKLLERWGGREIR